MWSLGEVQEASLQVVDKGNNIFNWGGLWLLYNTIWYYMILYGIIPHSPHRFQLYITVGNGLGKNETNGDGENIMPTNLGSM